MRSVRRSAMSESSALTFEKSSALSKSGGLPIKSEAMLDASEASSANRVNARSEQPLQSEKLGLQYTAR